MARVSCLVCAIALACLVAAVSGGSLQDSLKTEIASLIKNKGAVTLKAGTQVGAPCCNGAMQCPEAAASTSIISGIPNICNCFLFSNGFQMGSTSTTSKGTEYSCPAQPNPKTYYSVNNLPMCPGAVGSCKSGSGGITINSYSCTGDDCDAASSFGFAITLVVFVFGILYM